MASTKKILGNVKGKWVPTRPVSKQKIQQLKAGVFSKGGIRPPFARFESPQERLAKLVTRQTRFGAHIQLHQLAGVPKTNFEKKELEQILKSIKEKRKKGVSSRQLESLLAKAKVLQASALLRSQLGGRNPHIFQLMALTGLRFGLDSDELRRLASKLTTISVHDPTKKTWEGNPSMISKPLRFRLSDGQNLVAGVERVLANHPAAMDSKSLMSQLPGTSWDNKHQLLLNTTLQFLEVCGLVKKYPQAVRDGKTISVWAHTMHQNPPPDYPSLDMYLLNELRTGQKRFSQLYRQRKIGGRLIGNPQAPFSGPSITLRLDHLLEAGLVTITREKQTGISPTAKGAGATILQQVKLTPLGKKLAQAIFGEYEKTGRMGSLPEWGRKLLLGEKKRLTNK